MVASISSPTPPPPSRRSAATLPPRAPSATGVPPPPKSRTAALLASLGRSPAASKSPSPKANTATHPSAGTAPDITASIERGHRSSSSYDNQSEDGPSTSNIIDRWKANPIVIESRTGVGSVAFLDELHFVSGDNEGKIRCWRVEDGAEAGTPMFADGQPIERIAASKDGKWIVSGSKTGEVAVWNAETREKAEFYGRHDAAVRAVDISPDCKRIATGSDDKNLCIWSLYSTSGERSILGVFHHDDGVSDAKFSPDGSLIATATLESVRVYDHLNGALRVNRKIEGKEISTVFKAISLAWAPDSKRLFALSKDGNIRCLDISTGRTVSLWPLPSPRLPGCIAITDNGKLIAAVDNTAVSLWNTVTHEQVGPVIKINHSIQSIAISANYDLVACGGRRISLRNLRDTLPSPYIDDTAILTRIVGGAHNQLHEPNQAEDSPRGQQETLSDSIEKTVGELRVELAESQRTATEQNEIIKTLRSDMVAQETSSNNRIAFLEKAVDDLRAELADSKQKADSLARINHAHELMHQCESLYTQGRILDAADCLSELVDNPCQDVRTDKLVSNWLPEFTDRCTSKLEQTGDEALSAGKRDEAVVAYFFAASISRPTSNAVLKKWANTVLIASSVQEALGATTRFKHMLFAVYRTICDTLEGAGRFTEAIECFRRLKNELPDDTATHDERTQWEQDFQKRCVQELEKLGDASRDSRKHDEAIGYYSNILLLDPTNFNVLLKHSNELIELGPSSHRGYAGKHEALHSLGRYREAFEAFSTMLLKIEQSPNSDIRALRRQYVNVTSAIQKEISETIRDMPTVLIDTETGRLYDKTQQGEAFEELPIYDELRSSMTTQLNSSRIRTEVKRFYRYVMFSHRWQAHEPTFQQVENTSVYRLPLSPTFSKLQNFCKLVCTLQFKWAWTDTCCVNQLDKGVQQESVVAMFRWYRGSSLTIVHLLGVFSDSKETARLRKSVWNTRGWTYQEYVASKVVQFYTEDWKPYLGLQIFNHKESPDVLLEMEEAMNFATKHLSTLQPGLDRAREKLYLASTRQTTREEDIAYSLFGIFGVALPVIYGEGIQAVGRLLEHILTRSGDVTLLAWTGSSGSQHSYLPVDLTVYNQITPPHIPLPVEQAEVVAAMHSLWPDVSRAIELYNRLSDLPPLSLVAGRLRLPGIIFPLVDLTPLAEPESDPAVYRATTPMLDGVEIRTKADLSGMGGLLLIHPWISPLLDQDFSCGVPQFDPTTRALHLVVRLRQPFGALLLAPRARAQYRRVATDSLITARVREDVSLTDLTDAIRTVDIQ